MYRQRTTLYNSHFMDAQELTCDTKDAQLDFTQTVHQCPVGHLDVCVAYFVEFYICPTNAQCTWFVQKVSGLTTVHEVDKIYGV